MTGDENPRPSQQSRQHLPTAPRPKNIFAGPFLEYFLTIFISVTTLFRPHPSHFPLGILNPPRNLQGTRSVPNNPGSKTILDDLLSGV